MQVYCRNLSKMRLSLEAVTLPNMYCALQKVKRMDSVDAAHPLGSSWKLF